MKTTYKEIASLQDIFKKISTIDFEVKDSLNLKKAILELDKYYGEIDSKTINFLNNSKNSEVSIEDYYNKILEEEIILDNFPISIKCNQEVKMSAIDLIRVQKFLIFY